jgi:hypothetical protein
MADPEDCDVTRQHGPDDPVNPNPGQCTLCTGDTRDNIFFTPRAPGFAGRCILDEMTYEQVELVLLRSPRAKGDLLRITSNPTLVTMARNSRLVENPADDNENMRKRLHANSLPFYTLFKGNQDGTPTGRR